MIPPADATKAYQSALRGATVCVTGGAGFIGSHLVETLVSLGAETRVLDDLSSGRRETLEAIPGLRWEAGSILDDTHLNRAVRGCSVVFHLAAVASVPESLDRPERAVQVNTVGTMRVLQAARRNGVKRVVYAASSSAYGNAAQLPCRESQAPDPGSPYAAAKLAGEHLMRAWSDSFGLGTICLRYFNVFGPRQRADSAYAAVIARWMDALRRGEPVVIHGDGHQTRDFAFVSNAVHANLLAATAPAALTGQSVNVGSGRATSLLDLLAVLERVTGRRAERRQEAERPGDVRNSCADLTQAESLLGYRPVTSLEEGLSILAAAPIAEARAPAPPPAGSRHAGA